MLILLAMVFLFTSTAFRAYTRFSKVHHSRPFGSRSGLYASKRDVSKLPRVFLKNNQEISLGQSLDLDADTSHYLSNVMRLKVGFKFRGFNSRLHGGEYLFEVISVNKKSNEVVCMANEQLISLTEENRDAQTLPISLYFGVFKKPKMKMLFEKCTELGIRSFHPIHTQFTIMNGKEDFLDSSASYERIIRESVEQSERFYIPYLDQKVMKLSEMIDSYNYEENGPLLVCMERSRQSLPLIQALTKVAPHCKNGNIGLLLGPEGGFSTEEQALLASLDESQVILCTLGEGVLRAETAGIAALSQAAAWLDIQRNI